MNNLSIFTSPVFVYRASTGLQICESLEELEESSLKPYALAYTKQLKSNDSRYGWFIKPEDINYFFEQMQSEKQRVVVDFSLNRTSLIIYDECLEG